MDSTLPAGSVHRRHRPDQPGCTGHPGAGHLDTGHPGAGGAGHRPGGRRLRRAAAGRRSRGLPAVILGLVAVALIGIPGGSASAAPGDLPLAPAATASGSLCQPTAGRFSCLAERKSGHTTMVANAVTPATSSNYSPTDLRAAYQIPATTTTTTIAIVDAYDAPSVAADLAAYRAYYKLPACTSGNGCFQKVNQLGAASPLPAYDAGWAAETTLDVEMVSAVCPSCHILLVESDDDDRSGSPNMEAAVQRAVTMGAKYVSMSWGGSETVGETSDDASAGLDTPGVAFIAASGDFGYGTMWPAVNPNVVAVGGTALYRAANSRGFTEAVWGSTSGAGTGSGCSAYEPRPSWQAIAPITTLCSGRAANDVSIVGDPATGVAVYQSGQWWTFGGTSVGAPLIAAMYAIAGDPTSAAAASYPYLHPAAFTDVRTSLNGLCATALCAGATGWDGPTGLGTPIGVAAFSPNTVGVANPGTVTSYAGTGLTVNVHGTDSASLPLTYSATGLPPGATVRSNGTIAGTPTRNGAFTVTVTARDTIRAAGSTAFRWNVNLHRIATGSAPHIAGTLRRGSVVTASYSGWHRDTATGPTIQPAWHVQWYLDGKSIAGASSSSFRIPATYYHHRISFRLTATATYYSAYGYTTPASAAIG